MKKFKIYEFGILLSASLLLGGCENFLGKAPDERLTINNLDKINQTVIGAYQNSRSYRFSHFCTDDVTLTQGIYDSDPIIEDLYSWSQNIQDQTHQDAPAEYWRASYASIAAVNHALKALDNLKVDESDKVKADVIRGEALTIRAYNHFMLLNLFSKQYDLQTASADLGVPYVTIPENQLEVSYSRGTVEETYKAIEEDLLEGIRFLEANSKDFKPNKYHFTFPTIYLFASRFYTFRNKDNKDVEKAIQFAEKSIKAFGGVAVMRPWADYLADDFGPIDVDQQEVGMVQNSSTWTTFPWIYQTTLSLRNKVLSKNPIGFSDSRLDISYTRDGDVFTPAFFFVYDATSNGEKSAIDLFPIAEAVLNAAEGYTRAGDAGMAIKYLRDLASTVYTNYNADVLTVDNLKTAWDTQDEKEALIKTVLFERRLQFFLKGMRWFDIRRYKLEVQHLLTNGTTLKLSEVNPNRTFQIPNYAIASGMQPN